MTTKRKTSVRIKSQPIALRVNGKPVVNGAGAKLAAEWIGCTQTTGSQVGRGNARTMLEHIGAGEALVQMISIDSPMVLQTTASKLVYLSTVDDTQIDDIVSGVLRATAAALRNAARLREANHETR